ncbi:MAG: ABC transporter ATP-binding protein [Bryobacterales bacterium]|nr:ABC transporter ATP-binding protein [Bryobacterales bacterium]MDE0336410.1 ABC transporter ATP-binding protein [Caldilineaceae bacterium]
MAYGPIRALERVSLWADRGELVAIVGANGAGKSSLVKAIAGLVQPWEGSIQIPSGCDITQLPPHLRVKQAGLALVLEGRGILAGMTVMENLTLGGSVGQDRQASTSAEVMESLDSVFELFPELAKRKMARAGDLSGGEQQMLVLGRALLMHPAVLLVDEPTVGLAPLAVRSVLTAIRSLMEERDLCVLLVEQNLQLALEVASRMYVLDRGRLVLEGLTKELREDRRVAEAYLT